MVKAKPSWRIREELEPHIKQVWRAVEEALGLDKSNGRSA